MINFLKALILPAFALTGSIVAIGCAQWFPTRYEKPTGEVIVTTQENAELYVGRDGARLKRNGNFVLEAESNKSLILSTLAITGGPAGIIGGLLLRKPGDWSPEDVAEAIDTVKNGGPAPVTV